jgi:Tfp pilus assembly protein PilV
VFIKQFVLGAFILYPPLFGGGDPAALDSMVARALSHMQHSEYREAASLLRTALEQMESSPQPDPRHGAVLFVYIHTEVGGRIRISHGDD